MCKTVKPYGTTFITDFFLRGAPIVVVVVESINQITNSTDYNIYYVQQIKFGHLDNKLLFVKVTSTIFT